MVKKAFTLVEVLLALGLLTSAVFVISNLQIRSLLRIMSDRDDIEKIFLIKKELYKYYISPPKPPKKVTTKIESLDMTMVTNIIKPAAKSSLGPIKSRINILNTQASWVHERLKKDVILMTIMHKPLSKDDKESKE